MKIVAPALGDHVDYAAGGPAKLSIETTRLHLNFLYKLEGDVVVVAKLSGAEVGDF
jgi:hypothetical protein